jgi:hypothetical protein
MFDSLTLYRRRCVQSLIDVLEQAPLRWSARGSPAVDDAASGLLLLWTILRWERTFLIRCLEDLGVNLDRFGRAVDDRLRRILKTVPSERLPKAAAYRSLTDFSRRWLDRAARQAQSLGHDFLGTEHLFLALAAEGGEPLQSVFAEFDLPYDKVKNAIIESFARSPAGAAEDPVGAELVGEEDVFWGASWDQRPAAGLKRRFSMAVLMLHVTLFAVIFSVLRILNADPMYYLLTAFFVLGVAVGQMFLFRGKFPRAASVWAGAFVLPLEAVLATVFYPDMSLDARIGLSLLWLIGGVPLGAFLGYLSGGLTAGIVLVLDRLAARKKRIGANPENPDSEDDSQDGWLHDHSERREESAPD